MIAIRFLEERRRRSSDADHTTLNDGARPDRARDHPRRLRRLGDRRRRLRWGWGAQEDEDSIAAIHHALELGVNWIDTAAAVRLRALRGGRRARARRPRPSARTCSRRAGSPRGRAARRVQSLARDSLLRELEGSLERLGVDAIDLYQIHWPIPDEEIEEGWSTLAELKEQGLVRHIGVSNFRRRAAAADPADRAGRDAAAAVLADRARGRGGDPALRRARGDRRDRLLADGLRAADRRDDPRADRAAARGRLAQARRALPGAAAVAAPRARGAAARRSPTGTTRPRARSRSPGRCATPRSTARSSASAAPTRSTRSSPRRSSSSATRTSRRSKGGREMATDTHHDQDRLRRPGTHGRQHGRPVPRRRLRGLRRGAKPRARAGARRTTACSGATRHARSPRPPTSSSRRSPTTTRSRRWHRAPTGSSPASPPGRSGWT